MRKVFYLFPILIGCISLQISAQNVNIPDPVFKAYLVGIPTLNTNADSEIQVSEALVYNQDIDIIDSGITDFTGLQAFVAVQQVFIDGNLQSTLDVSGMTALEKLITDDNDSLQSITFGSNPNLMTINISYCNISNLDVTALPALVYLYMGGNPITSIDLSNNPNLEVLGATGCDLSSLDLSNNLGLKELYTYFNTDLTYLDLSMHSQLSFLNVMNCNLTYLNVANGGNAAYLNTGDDFRSGGNHSLYSVCVDDTLFSNMYWNNPWYVDTFTVFTDTCTPPTSTTGIENMNKNSIQIMNNPTTDFAYLSEPCSFEILSLSGTVVEKKNYSKVVDLRDLNPGIYIVRIDAEKGHAPVSFKVLKQ